MNKIAKSALAALFGSTAIVGANAVAQEVDATTDQSGEEVVSDEIVVRGFRIPDEKRATSEVASILDADDLARTGDSDIGGALQRVTGLSLSEGRFIIVRGLNDRYSSVTLDGSPLPSPEPLRRVVPLDIVPTSILSGTLVQKTYSPQFSAEFGGGLVELRTRSIPDEPYLQVGVSVSSDTETWGQDGLTYRGGNSDDLGFDDGARDVPGVISDAFFGTTLGAFDQATVDQAFEYERTTVITSGEVAPSWGGDIAFGASKDLANGMRIGANVAIGFSNDWQTVEGRREQGFTGSAEQAGRGVTFGAAPGANNDARAFDFTRTEQTIESNAMATIGLELAEDHTVTWTNLLLRSTVKEARISDGWRGEDPTLGLLQENLEFIEREVRQTQLRGDHVFTSLNNLEFTWRAAYGEATRDSPYQRSFLRYREAASDPFVLPIGPASNSISRNPINLAFSDIDDTNVDAGVDFLYPLMVGSTEIEVKFGANYTDKEREILVREFQYVDGDSFTIPTELTEARNDVVLSPGVTASDAINLSFNPGQDSLDNATSTLKVEAAYASAEFEVGPYIRVSAGGRYEASEQTTDAFRTGLPDVRTQVTLDESYFLPAVTATWNPIGDLQVRAGFSQTITRPQFRELTPAVFTDDQTDQRITGNPFLVNSEIDNFDVRGEYYFSRGQFATLGFFYKDIQNPIETTTAFVGEEVTQTYVNAPSASLYGVEAEFERTFALGDLFGEGWATTDFVAKANYTWSQSEVSASGNVITSLVSSQPGAGSIGLATPTSVPGAGYIVDGRELQGQSEHLLNFQFGLEDAERNFRATLLVNYASERIRQTESNRSGTIIPAVLEQPPLTIDLVASKGFDNVLTGGWEVGVALRNLLGEGYEATQTFSDGTTAQFDTYDLGQSVKLSLKKSF